MSRPLETFFDALEPGLMRTEYADRLREEIAAHVEDKTSVLLLSGFKEEEAEARSVQSLGDPRNVRNSFNRAMKLRSPLHCFLETVFVAVLSVPLYFLCAALLFSSLMMASSIFAPGQEDFGVEMLWHILPQLVGILAALPCFYLLTIGRLAEYWDTRKTRNACLTVLVMLPMMLVFRHFLTLLGMDDHEVHSSLLPFGTLALVLSFGYGAASVWWSSRMHEGWIRETATGMKQDTSLSRFALRAKEWMPTMLGALFLLYVAVTTGVQWMTDQRLLQKYDTGWVSALLAPRMTLEGVLHVSLLGLNDTNPLIGIWAFGILLTLLGVYCLYVISEFMRRRKRTERRHFPWLQACILSYVIALLCLSSTQAPVIGWEVPVSNVSQRVEKRLAGPFARFGKYLDHSFSTFTYGVASDSDGFLIQTASERKQLRLSHIVSTGAYSLVREKDVQPFTSPFPQLGEINPFMASYTLPTGLTCYHRKLEAFTQPGMEIEVRNVSSLTGYPVTDSYEQGAPPECNFVTYRGKTVYTMPDPYVLKAAAVSSDERWLLLVLSATNTDFVYLADVGKNLNDT
ncbi:hypothetical protein HY734_03355 [Candidatus Uhrbacteria bacterium]|nr:hypothetical protein [Candidatus Uhrbacteria bacterium]